MFSYKCIAILGRSRVGKDTIASLLSEQLGYPILRLSTPVKDSCAALFDIPRGHFETDHKEHVDERYNKTPRDLLVWMTRAVQRDFPSDFFVRSLMTRIHSLFSTTQGHSSGGVIIPDVRFEHDVHLLRQLGALIVKVTRNDAPVLHAHEDSIDALRGDIVVENNGTLDELRKRAIGIGTYVQTTSG